jgi:hypothetical protein
LRSFSDLEGFNYPISSFSDLEGFNFLKEDRLKPSRFLETSKVIIPKPSRFWETSKVGPNL